MSRVGVLLADPVDERFRGLDRLDGAGVADKLRALDDELGGGGSAIVSNVRLTVAHLLLPAR